MQSQEQIVSQLQQKVKQKEQDNLKLLKELHAVKQASHLKDKKILMLGQTISELTSQLQKFNEEQKNNEMLVKVYHNNLYKKNVELSQFQQQAKTDITNFQAKKSKQIEQLRLILTEQEKQINQMMGEHQKMINTFSQALNRQKLHQQERELVQNFNKQLQIQIEELQNQNQLFLNEIAETRKQLELQNRQGEDLMCQMGAMLDHIKTEASD